MAWQPVIGLEIHIQLATQSKLFSASPCRFGDTPNSNASVIDLGLPGVLPVLNKEVVEMAIKLGLALKATVNQKSIFARKNYFYPDLPKGYQVTQDRFPIVSGGRIDINLEDGTQKTVGITRAHLEEDAGKSIHSKEGTGIDLNRAGMPLLELVSEPVLHSPKEAIAYLKAIHQLVQYLGICSGNMQEGAFRCDANISMRLSASHPFGTRVEIKNINSFKFVEKALQYEIERQLDCIKHNEPILQETRLYNADLNITKPMRGKENANDYRYFPEPDLPALIITDQEIQEVADSMPELPWEIKSRFIEHFKLTAYDADVLCSSKALANFYESCVKSSTSTEAYKTIANIIIGELLGALNKHQLTIEQSPISPDSIAELSTKIMDNTISITMSKIVFESLWQQEGSVSEIITRKGLIQITDPQKINEVIQSIIDNNPKQYQEYLDGKDKLFGFFVGQSMKAMQGKANPKVLNECLKVKLDMSKKTSN